jgi:hypothetical protein
MRPEISVSREDCRRYNDPGSNVKCPLSARGRMRAVRGGKNKGENMMSLIALGIWLLMGAAIVGWGIWKLINKRRTRQQ